MRIHKSKRCCREPIPMKSQIQIKLFAGLQSFAPSTAEHFEITPGMTIRELLTEIQIPIEKARLIFINGIKADLDARLKGGERVGIFPPVGGG
jgi:molybdopterin converting factor small subunit